jgi:hypothetical protein
MKGKHSHLIFHRGTVNMNNIPDVVPAKTDFHNTIALSEKIVYERLSLYIFLLSAT